MERPVTRRWLPALAFALLLLGTSLMPLPTSGGTAVPTVLGVPLDKWVHAVSYGVLTGLLAWGRDTRRVTVVTALAGVAILYGAGVEVLQGFVGSRDTSSADLVANTVGALVASGMWLAARGRDR